MIPVKTIVFTVASKVLFFKKIYKICMRNLRTFSPSWLAKRV